MILAAIRQIRRPGGSIAMALALISGTALGVGMLETPAYAQKKSKASRGFAKVYGPINQMVQGEGFEAAKQKIPELISAIQNGADRNAAGGLIYSLGVKTGDNALQLQGLEMMINSGELEPEKLGRLSWAVFQLNRQQENWEAARKALEGVIAANHSPEATLADGTSRVFGADDLRLLGAETYVDAEDYTGAANYLKSMINSRASSGQTPPEPWIRRGLGVSYNNELGNDAVDFSTMLVRYYPNEVNWRDAVNIQRNLFLYEDGEMLDLLRLAAEKGTLENERDYIDFADAADVLRRPNEVKRIIEAGIAAGKLNGGDAFISETLTSAGRRAAGETSDLGGLESEAKASGASARIATTSGDAYLSNGMGDKAEAMYQLALQRPGVDEATVYTHLGMAQLMQGKKTEAVESFKKVQGKRKPIAELWIVHAEG